jgi:hypothetical protein
MILGFKDTFVQAVVAGTKPHTIRSGQRWKVGTPIQFYQNVRQRNMTKIRPDGVVMVVQQIRIARAPERFLGPAKQPTIQVDGRELTPLECQELSRRDGFEDFAELLKFFIQTHGLHKPFEGQLVGWTDLRY